MTKKNDLGVKVGTKEEAAWTVVRDNATKEIEQNKRIIEMDEAIIELADRKILEQKKVK